MVFASVERSLLVQERLTPAYQEDAFVEQAMRASTILIHALRESANAVKDFLALEQLIHAPLASVCAVQIIHARDLLTLAYQESACVVHSFLALAQPIVAMRGFAELQVHMVLSHINHNLLHSMCI